MEEEKKKEIKQEKKGPEFHGKSKLPIRSQLILIILAIGIIVLFWFLSSLLYH